MAARWHFAVVTALWAHQALAADSSSAVPSNNLNGFISQVAGIASDISAANTNSPTSSKTSSSSSSSSATSSTTSSSAASTSATAAAAAASSTSPTSAPDASSGGLDARTRNIIIAVCVVVGLILLGVILGCLICRRRRRRRTHRVESPGSEVGAAAWNHRHHDHHNHAPSERSFDLRDSAHDGRYPPVSPMSQRNSGSMMSGVYDGSAPPYSNHHHSARDSLNGHSPTNPNAANPFTPLPPIARKPVPSSTSSTSTPSNHRNHFEDAAIAGAGAAAGAAAMHHHHHNDHNGHNGHNERSHSPSPLRSNPTDQPHSLSPIRELEQPEKYHRPPTPMGLAAFGNASHGAVEPSIAAHEHEYHSTPQHMVESPTDAQRRSLSGRSEYGALDVDHHNPPLPERSPKRSSFGDVPANVSAAGLPPPMLNNHAMRTHNSFDGYVSHHGGGGNGNRSSSSNSNGYGNGTVNSNSNTNSAGTWRDSAGFHTDSSSPDSWTSAQQLPQPPGVPYEPGRRYSGGSSSMYENARQPSRSPRRTSFGPDGKPRRLRFSDVRPEEYRYDDEQPVGQAM